MNDFSHVAWNRTKMLKIELFILAFFIPLSIHAISFKKISEIKRKVQNIVEAPIIADSDRNGNIELFFVSPHESLPSGNATTYIYEYQPINEFHLAKIFDYPAYQLCRDVGLIDADSLYDLVIDCWFYILDDRKIGVIESPHMNAFPDSLAWFYPDSLTIRNAPVYITNDLDGDGKGEILNGDPDNEWVYIYEETGDNQYELVYSYNLYSQFGDNIPVSFVYGDFDLDGLKDFIAIGCYGETGGPVSQCYAVTFENCGDNDYQLVTYDSLYSPSGTSYTNLFDSFSANDLDGDGKPEFCIQGDGGGYYGWTWIEEIYQLYEMAGNDEYEKSCEIFIQTPYSIIMHEDPPFCVSCAADVDGDGREEMLLSAGYKWFVYRAISDNQFQEVFSQLAPPTGQPWPNDRCWYLTLTSSDINKNGLNEIVVTPAYFDIQPDPSVIQFWEKTIDIEVYHPVYGDTFINATEETLRFKILDTVAVSSGALWLRKPDGNREFISLIGSRDSTYLWTVPQMSGYPYRIQICAYGPGGRADSVLSASFRIIETGVEETALRFGPDALRLLEAYPNPFHRNLTFKFQIPGTKSQMNQKCQTSLKIYDAAGRLVKQFSHLIIQSFNQLVWDAKNEEGKRVPTGIYFCILKTNEKEVMEKTIFLNAGE